MAEIAALVALVASVCVVCAALFVGSRAREAMPDGNVPVYRARKYYAAGLVAVLVGGLVLTLPRVPYGAYAAVAPAVHVDATGRMWSWQLRRTDRAAGEPLVVPKGALIEFDVTAADVTHGFGVYDDQGRLLGQTQAMPGYVNHLRMVFDAPGRYHVLCLEYCGLAHHFMLSEFTVQ